MPIDWKFTYLTMGLRYNDKTPILTVLKYSLSLLENEMSKLK